MLQMLKTRLLPILVIILLLLGHHTYLEMKYNKLLRASVKFGHFVGCIQATQGMVPVCIAMTKVLDDEKLIDIIKKDDKLRDQLEQKPSITVVPPTVKDI